MGKNKRALRQIHVSTDETKVDEIKVDETKIDETKVDETKVDETKVDETKADETKETFRTKRAREVFASHNIDKLFFTSDNECFTQYQFAVMHAQSLSDQVVTTIYRKEIE